MTSREYTFSILSMVLIFWIKNSMRSTVRWKLKVPSCLYPDLQPLELSFAQFPSLLLSVVLPLPKAEALKLSQFKIKTEKRQMWIQRNRQHQSVSQHLHAGVGLGEGSLRHHCITVFSPVRGSEVILSNTPLWSYGAGKSTLKSLKIQRLCTLGHDSYGIINN